jgi:hypothetical protein
MPDAAGFVRALSSMGNNGSGKGAFAVHRLEMHSAHAGFGIARMKGLEWLPRVELL